MSIAYDGKLLHGVDTARDWFPELVRTVATTLGRVLVYVAVALAIRRLLQFQMELGGALGFARPGLEWSVLALAATGPANILIHEGGHYLAGIALGQYCRRFVIGPVELAHRNGTWSLHWIPIRQAGLVDFVPSTFAHFRQRRSICVAAGPAASMLAGLLFTLLSYRARTASLFWIWSYCAQWSLVGLLGLLPMRRGAARSDGCLLWELARGGAATDELQAKLLVASSHATPLRLREWPNDLIGRLVEAPADRRARRYHAYLAYVHLLDRGEPQPAGRCLDGFLSEWTAGDPPEYALEAAWFLAFHRNDVDGARRWLTLQDRDAEPWVRLRARAAVEWAAGRHERARQLAKESLSHLRAAPACGAHEYEKERLHELLGS
jgi:hypothetical protein